MTASVPHYVDHDWGPFPNTVLHFEATGDAIDLRLPIAPATVERLHALGFPGSFAIVTAYNPMGHVRPEVINAARAAHLCAMLHSHDVPFIAVEAGSPDGAHTEPSLAIAVTRSAAIAVAERYDQQAIFWFDGAKFWIVPARSTKAAIPLPVD